MRMEEILPASRIRLVDEVADRQEAIRRLIAMLDADGCLNDPEQFARDLAAREARATRRCRAAWTCRTPGLPGWRCPQQRCWCCTKAWIAAA